MSRDDLSNAQVYQPASLPSDVELYMLIVRST